MNLYRYIFLGGIGQPLGQQELHAASDEDALELGRLLDYAYAINVMRDGREAGVVMPRKRRKAARAD